MSASQIKIGFTVPISFTRDEEWIIASCPALDVVTQGKTKDHARANLEDALFLFFESCIERHVLDDMLSDCSLVVAKDDTLRQGDDAESLTIQIPLMDSYLQSDQCRG